MKGVWLAVFIGGLLGGCVKSGETHAGERYLVTAPRTSFYKFGPAQSMGPDFALLKGQTVTMVKRQFGYSNVTTDQGQAGYISTDDILPAPPEPSPSPTATPAPEKKRASKRKERRPTPAEERLLPLPELPGM